MINSFIFLAIIISLVALDTLCDDESSIKILYNGKIWQKGNKWIRICERPEGLHEPVKFLDYSLKFNAYVAVCDNLQNTKIRIEKIDPNQTTKLMANDVHLMQQYTSIVKYSLDWLNGLLYYTDGMGIYVLDLRKPFATQFHLYTRPMIKGQMATIASIIVRPQVAQLIWLETFEEALRCDVKQASQNAQQVTTLFRTDGTKFEEIIYDEQEDLYILIKQAVDRDRLVRVLDGEKLYEPKIFLEIKITAQDFSIQQVKFFRKSLIFTAMESWEFELYKINISENIESLRSEWEMLKPITFDREKWEFFNEYNRPNLSKEVFRSRFFIFDPDSRIDSNEDDEIICESHVCLRSEKDFCIPINQTYSQCTSGEIFRISHGIADRFIIILTIIFLLSMILLILLVYFLFFSKQKTRFYPIRLNRLNRVESSKLQVKPPATEEIAD